MKKIIISTIVTLLSVLTSFGQSINYKVKKDDPSKPANILINLDLLQLDMSENFEAMSVNVGAWGYVDLLNIIEIDYKIEKSWLTMQTFSTKTDSAVGNLDLEAGATLHLFSKTKHKDVNVVLNVSEGYKYTTTTSLPVPATINKVTSARAGFIFKRSTFEDDKFFSQIHPMNTFGMYAGMSLDGFVNLQINADGYGDRQNSIGNRMYFDVLFVPINTVSLNYRNYNNPLGWRVGYQLFQSFPREDTGRRFGKSGDFQIGYRPYAGYFITGSIGITIMKKH